MPGMNERDIQDADHHQQTAAGPAGASCSGRVLHNNQIPDIFSRSGWRVRPFYPADGFMAEGVITLGAWKHEDDRKNPCFEGSEPSFLVCFISESCGDIDSALEKAHAVSWSLGHRILLVADPCLITMYDASNGILQKGHMQVLASIPCAGLTRFDNPISELLDSYAEPLENSQNFLHVPQRGVQQAAGCPEALVSLVTRLKDALSRKIYSCEPGLLDETHERLVTRLLFGILFISMLSEQYGINGKYRGTAEQTDLVSLHTTIIRGTLEEIATGPGEIVSAESILEITGLLLKEPYEPLILSLVPPRTFSYAFEYFSLIKSGKKKKKRSGWPYGNKNLMPLTEGCPRIPDDLVRYCTGRLSQLLNERKTECTNFPVVLDPRCGSGQFLLYLCEALSQVFTGPVMEPDTGPLMSGSASCFTPTNDKEKVMYSLYGLDPDPVKAESARFVLFLWLNRYISDGDYLNRQALAFFSRRHHLFDTIRTSQVLYAPDLLTDLDRALLGPERAGKIHTFDLNQDFPEIAQRGGFDAVTGNFICSSHRLSRHIREYLQGHFATYDPGADISVYMLEKSVSLLKKQGICSAMHNCGWTGASFAGRLRNFISTMQIIEMAEVAEQPGEEERANDIGILIFSKEPPLNDIIAAKVTSGPCREIFRQVQSARNLIEHPGPGTGGWSFRDQRSIRLKQAIMRHGIPLEHYVMGELFQGINGDSVRFLLSRPENLTIPPSLPGDPELLPFVSGTTLCAYCMVAPSGILPVTPRDPGPGKTEELLHRFTGGGIPSKRNMQDHLPDSEEMRSLILRILKYAGMKDKILIPLGIPWPACTSDRSGCIPDESILFIPHWDLYLLAFLNSAIPQFLMNLITCEDPLKKGCISPQWLHRLPVHVIDGSDRNESRLHDRIVLLAERIISLKAIRVPDTDNRIASEINKRVLNAEGEINRCFYSIYGFSEREIEIIGRFCTT
jgi:hypothetical protein